MSKKRLLATIVLSATFAVAGARADVTHTPLDDTNRGVAAQGDTDEAAMRRLLEQFRRIKIPLSQAVAIAERLHNGSRPVDVSFEISGPAIYRVRTVRNERIWENVVDANTGSVTEKEILSSLKELDREDLSKIIALKTVEQELSDAVRIAEKAGAGSAVAGGLMKQDGKLNFVVIVASGNRLKEVMLEPPPVRTEKSVHH
ncbi:PepSY domain-containing protein [Bradyrhizobium sp. 31Argb]|uniref:PepSY domain-containing protein n=1 Tax=unclassified Bradyrhizobium TaxID=2631580 RepID=UPI00102EA9CA|nr:MULTISPECIES: PepSY domain-containing protein [unclassified Bradyrhizobium]MDI4231799.1 PepSY domain-containing protein [Bradyrhizobium sp. Arg237L]TAI65652.1 peptidase [Bradyrhizobium sp. Leo170]